MRLLHTSDWHLGRSLHRADLHDAQSAFLDHLVETARTECVDAVLVSGDVYDRALPPVEAVDLCADALARLRATGARVVVISGNHDSARRLGFGSALFDEAGVHVRTRPEATAEPVLLRDEHGPVAVYPIPYLEPIVAGGRSHLEVLGRAVAGARNDLAGRGVARSVVLAHAWVHGGGASESERDVSVGGVAAVPAALFDGFDYVALGHLHGPQTLASHLRYSGSPLPYSFSESGQVKGSWLVNLGPRGLERAEYVPAPRHRGLSRLRGTLGELLADPAHAGAERDFVSVTLTDPARPEGAMDRLRARFPHTLVLEWQPDAVAADPRDYRQRVVGVGDLALAVDFVSHVRGSAAEADEQVLLAQAFEAVRVAAEIEAPERALDRQAVGAA